MFYYLKGIAVQTFLMQDAFLPFNCIAFQCLKRINSGKRLHFPKTVNTCILIFNLIVFSEQAFLLIEGVGM